MASVPGITAAATPVETEAGVRDKLASTETFLQLLIAQIRNQDPLNPQDPTQFVSQLAEFSSLEQLLDMKEALEGIQATLSAQQEPSEPQPEAQSRNGGPFPPQT